MQKEYASRAIMGRPRDNVINPLTVEAVLEHALQFNPVNKYHDTHTPHTPKLFG